MGKKMAGTNEFAFFRCKSICTGGGVQNQAKKNSKNAFRTVPVQKFTFPGKERLQGITRELRNFSDNNYSWSDKLGGILGEDLWVILHSK